MGPIAAAPDCAVILIKEKYFKNKIMNFATEISYHVMHRSNSKININVTLPMRLKIHTLSYRRE